MPVAASQADRTPLPPTPSPAPAWEIVAYAALACALAWAVAAPGLLGAVEPDLTPALVPAAQLAPMLATIPFLLVRRCGPVIGWALRWNRSGRWVALGVGVVAVIAAAQLGLGLVVGWRLHPTDLALAAAAAVVPVLAVQAVFAFGEETGWRGWLVTRTQHLGFTAAAVISSVVWVVWHLPALALLPMGSVADSAAYLLGIASWAPFLVALRMVSGSVWPVVIAHGALNSVRVFLLQSIAESGGVDWRVEAFGWLLWLAAAALLIRRAGGRVTPVGAPAGRRPAAARW